MMLDQLVLWEDAVPRPGALNMALDEAMLRAAESPWLRVYSWDQPAISIGFSQPLAVIPESRRHWPLHAWVVKR